MFSFPFFVIRCDNDWKYPFLGEVFDVNVHSVHYMQYDDNVLLRDCTILALFPFFFIREHEGEIVTDSKSMSALFLFGFSIFLFRFRSG